jgi:hypothetical protein
MMHPVCANLRLARRARGPASQRRALVSGTMLAGAVLVAALATSAALPALADGGAGGTGGAGDGGTGGVASATGAGGDGGDAPSLFAGGGGGGAGATGGNGGNGNVSFGGSGGGGGPGAAVAGGSGTDGTNGGGVSDGAGGGGGGAHGAVVTTTTTNSAVLSGGNGGKGGSDVLNGGGGGGGAGGYGAVVNGSILTYTNTSTIAGGNGGAGGGTTGVVAGSGGDGGIGVLFTNPGTLSNAGSIAAGNGGAAGTSNGGDGASGAGGAGIVGADLTIINSGTIAGGLSGDGVTRANAVTFGGTNILELRAGSTITGNVVAFSTADTLRLGGTTNASFDVSQIGATAQYQGFGIFQKTGGSTWTLTGTNTAALAWTINAGTLAVNGTMANSTMTVNAGGALGGTGTVGNTTINGGTLAPGNSIGTLTIQGNLVLTAAAAYIVEVSPTQADPTNVTGTATLAGTVQAVFGPGSYIARAYTILSAAGGRSGTFGNLTTSGLPAGFTASLSYGGTDVILNLTAALGSGPSALPNGGLNQNQFNVAGAQQLLQQRRHAAAEFPQRVRAHRQQSDQHTHAAVGRSGDRRAAGRVQADGSVPCAHDRPVRRRQERRRRRRRTRARLCARSAGAAGGDRARLFQGDEDAGVQVGAGELRAALDRLGRGLRRLQQDQRRSRGGRLA